MIKIKSDKIIVGEKLFDGFVYVDNGKIVEVSKKDKPCEEYDYTGYYVSAGFIDMHTHGAGGYAFMNSTVEDVIAGCDYHFQHGTTSIVPTISAGEFETMKQAVINIHEAKAAVDVQFHVVLEVERVGDVLAAARHEDASAALRGAVVDRLLDGGGIVRFPIRPRAVARHVILRGHGAQRGKRRRQRQNRTLAE